MQIKVISVPVSGGDSMNEELNKFLRGPRLCRLHSIFYISQIDKKALLARDSISCEYYAGSTRL